MPFAIANVPSPDLINPVPAVVAIAWPCKFKVFPDATVRVAMVPPVARFPAAVTVTFSLAVRLLNAVLAPVMVLFT